MKKSPLLYNNSVRTPEWERKKSELDRKWFNSQNNTTKYLPVSLTVTEVYFEIRNNSGILTAIKKPSEY
jgi:hypothetical protein